MAKGLDNVKPKPPYKTNPQHDTHSSSYKPRKTPEPPDAEEVYKNAIPHTGNDGRVTWYGMSKDGKIYQFLNTNDGTYHFAGSLYTRKDLNGLPTEIRRQFKL